MTRTAGGPADRAGRWTDSAAGPRHAWLAAAIGLIAAAFWLRLTILAPTELGLDGLLSVGIARLDPLENLDFSLRDVHPPLYYLLLRGWLDLTGPGFFAARWPSVAAGLLSLALTARIVGWWFNRPTAAIALALLAGAPAAVFLSATVRDFALGALFSLATWAYLPIRDERDRPARPIAFALLSAAGLLTWYFHLIVWLIQAPIVLRLHRRWQIAWLAGGLIALPWYAVFLRRLIGPAGGFGASGQPPLNVEPRFYLEAAGRALTGDLPLGLPSAPLAWLWLTAVVVGVIVLARRRPGAAAVVAIGSAAGVLAALVLFRFWVGGDFLTRYFLLPGWFGAVAIATVAGQLPAGFARVIVTGLLLVPGLIFYNNFLGLQSNGGPRAELVAWFAGRIGPADSVIFDDLADQGYFWLADRSGAESAAYHTRGAAFLRDRWVDRVMDTAARAADRGGSLWRVRAAEAAEAADLTAAIANRWWPAERLTPAGWVVERYQRPARWSSVGATFGGSIELVSVTLPPSARTTGPIPVVLRWRAVAAPGADYTVFVHLVDATGRRVGQHDGVPAAGQRPTGSWAAGEAVTDLHWLDVTPGAPPGRYQVVAGLYREATRLTLPDGRNSLGLGWIDLVP